MEKDIYSLLLREGDIEGSLPIIIEEGEKYAPIAYKLLSSLEKLKKKKRGILVSLKKGYYLLGDLLIQRKWAYSMRSGSSLEGTLVSSQEGAYTYLFSRGSQKKLYIKVASSSNKEQLLELYKGEDRLLFSKNFQKECILPPLEEGEYYLKIRDLSTKEVLEELPISLLS